MEFNEGGREVIDRLIESTPKPKEFEGEREVKEGLIERFSKVKIHQKRREGGHRLIKDEVKLEGIYRML